MLSNALKTLGVASVLFVGQVDAHLINLAPDGTATASQTWSTDSPSKAIDEDENTMWNSGGYPVQWIEIDFGKDVEIDQIDGLVSQLPSGNTHHDIYLDDELSFSWAGFTIDKQLLTHKFDTSLTIQKIRIETTESTSWVGWVEIQVWADDHLFKDGFESPSYTISTINDEHDAGRYSYLAIGSDNLPIISYFDGTDNSLKLAKCNDIKCSGGDEIISTVDDQGTWVGSDTSIAIGQDGMPVIAYTGNVSVWHPLIVAKCNDLACSGGDESISIVDHPAFHVGFRTSIAIGFDGFPVISHTTELEGINSLRVTKCNDAACAGGDETSTTIHELGGDTALAIGIDGFPVIGNFSRETIELIVVKCNDPACTGDDETSTIIANDILGDNMSLAIGTDGFPIIAYKGNLGPVTKVVKCNDVGCAGGNEQISIVDNQGEDPGSYPSIAIGTNGFPVIAYEDRSAALRQVVVVACNDMACSGNDETRNIVDGPSFSGQFISMAIGSDGLPILSYYNQDPLSKSLKVLHCKNPDCS